MSPERSPASGDLSDWSRQRSGHPRHLPKRPLADHGVTSACGTDLSGLKYYLVSLTTLESNHEPSPSSASLSP